MWQNIVKAFVRYVCCALLCALFGCKEDTALRRISESEIDDLRDQWRQCRTLCEKSLDKEARFRMYELSDKLNSKAKSVRIEYEDVIAIAGSVPDIGEKGDESVTYFFNVDGNLYTGISFWFFDKMYVVATLTSLTES